MTIFIGMFEDLDDIEDAFVEEGLAKILSECTVHLASYSEECYEGSADVIFENEDGLFHVTGFHCSCYGLEGQWAPDRITWESLAKSYLYEFNDRVQELCRAHGVEVPE